MSFELDKQVPRAGCKIIPLELADELRRQPVKRAEVIVYDRLRSQLGSDWLIIYDLSWLHTYDAQCDFLVFHRNKGGTVIEVKGGLISIDSSGNWTQSYKTGTNSKLLNPGNLPQEQANRIRYSLVDLLAQQPALETALVPKNIPEEEAITYLKNYLKSAINYAVCFPDCKSNGSNFHPSLPAKILIDSQDLEDVEPKLLSIVTHGSSGVLAGEYSQKNAAIMLTLELLSCSPRELQSADGYSDGYTIRVQNQQRKGKEPTYSIKDLLRRDGFDWDGKSNCWIKKGVPDFDIDAPDFAKSAWSKDANCVVVSICNSSGICFARYLIREGTPQPTYDYRDQIPAISQVREHSEVYAPSSNTATQASSPQTVDYPAKPSSALQPPPKSAIKRLVLTSMAIGFLVSAGIVVPNIIARRNQTQTVSDSQMQSPDSKPEISTEPAFKISESSETLPRVGKGTVTEIVDADTIRVTGIPHKIDLFGIDSPEFDQKYGPESRNFLAVLTQSQLVTAAFQSRPERGRIEADITLADGRKLSEEMVRAGCAWYSGRALSKAERNSNKKNLELLRTLSSLQAQAREQKLGLWKYSKPVPPWVFRKRKYSHD